MNVIGKYYFSSCRKVYSLDIYFTKPPSGLPLWLSSKESACNEEDSEAEGLIPGFGRSLEEEMATHFSILGHKE